MFTNPTRDVTLIDMLTRREERVREQQQLQETYHRPLISFAINMSGPIKSSEEIKHAFYAGKEKILSALDRNHLSILDSIEHHKPTGDALLLAVDGGGSTLKDLAIAVEETHRWGRLFDIDIIDEKGKKISRPNFRTCLLCDKQAQDCAHNRAHTVEEMQERILKLLTI